jgi:hypothetical protein
MNTSYRNLNQFFDTGSALDIKTSWNDEVVPWECYRCPGTRVVYFVHNKCASTLYDALMVKLNWESTTTQAIDWQHDIVISHIRNPLVKHRKGIIEDLINYYPSMIAPLTTAVGLTFLSNITSIDAHSYTIRQMLGSHAVKVRWIPIDIDLDHKQFTLDLFERHGATVSSEIKNWFFDLPKLNSSTARELAMYDALAQLDPPPVIRRLIDFDLCLYDAVLTPAEPENFQIRVTQLIKTGLSNDAAVGQADAEVFSGQYRTWQF